MLPIAFTSPFMLLALGILPALWILLRLVPPRPARIDFPPLRLILDLLPTQETPARTPWWLTLLRLAMAAFVILMLSGPVWQPSNAALGGKGPLLLLADNGWAAARDWDLRRRVIGDALDAAQASGRPVALLATAEMPGDLSLAPATAVRDRLAALPARAWTPDRMAHLKTVEAFLKANPDGEIIWYSDGLAMADGAGFVAALAGLKGDHALHVVQDTARSPLGVADADNAPGGLSLRVLRAFDTQAPVTGLVRALDMKGLALGETAFSFPADKLETGVRFDMPVELRNDIARIEVAGEASAGAVQLLDDNWRRRVVGILSGQTRDTAQPLLSPGYYLSRAIEPFADTRSTEWASSSEAISRFIEQKLPVIVLADIGNLGEEQAKLTDWVENGGVLIRFAGARLAAGSDDLVPVTLRRGGRTLGGALSWEKPQPLGSFPAGGPFAGLTVPTDVTVTRQVLAEPDGDLPGKTWATLADGTPLVTAARRGRGLVVLFHVTADTTWSNLPLSGTFVDMLRRLVALSGTAVQTVDPLKSDDAAQQQPAAPIMVAPARTLDGQGAFEAPPVTAKPVRADAPGIGRAEHPPGFYGPPEGLVAVNTLAPGTQLQPLQAGAIATTVGPYAVAQPVLLAAPLFLVAFLLLLADALIVWIMAGGRARLGTLARRLAGAGAVVLALALLAPPQPARAQAEKPFESALKTHLAYVITGDRQTDETSLAGLKGLTAVIAERTALEPGEPVGVDLSRDELSFHALIYWPIVEGAEPPPAETMARVDAFMRSGGTVVFDTRDALQQGTGLGGTPAGETLKRILSTLDIPELEPVPRNHVLTKTFYLMEKFPGRYDSGDMWVEAMPAETDDEAASDRPARSGDGVSPIIITSNDLAAAWAIGDDFKPLYPVTPGGPRQRELAFRAGINLVMYALTGNYKADQVHVPALLERLGQ